MKPVAAPIDPDVVMERLAPVFARHPEVAAAYLFGSVARGSAGPGSDLDIGLVYCDRPSREQHDRVAPGLAVEIERALGFEPVDLVDLESQGPIFCHRILCEGRRLYAGDDRRRIDFESDVIVRALDSGPPTISPRAASQPPSAAGSGSDPRDLRPDPVPPGHSQNRT